MLMHANQNWKIALILVFSVLLMSLACVANLRAQIREDEVDFQILATVTSQKDNSLWSLAEKYYGNPRLWPLISDMNRIADPTDIPTGATIYIPVKGAGRIAEKLTTGAGAGILTTVSYRKGDTLWSLAERYYGNPWLWPRIADANGITDVTDIPPGAPIHIPVKDTKQTRSRVVDADRISNRTTLPMAPPTHIPVKDTKPTAEKLLKEIGFEVMAIVFYQKGDTLRDLAGRYYDDPKLWPHIADANGISDETTIPVGTPIYIPTKPSEITATEPKIPVKEPAQPIEKPRIEKVKPEPTIAPPVRKRVGLSIADQIAPPFERYKIVGAKNLFRRLGWQERKSNELTYVLAGTIGKAKERKALIVDEKRRNSYYVSEGDSVGEAKAVDISEDRVTLYHEGKRFELAFDTSLMFGDPRESSKPEPQRTGFPPGTGSGVAPQYRSQAPLANGGGRNGPIERWRSMDRDARLMFYSYVRKSGSSLGNVLRDAELRTRMLDKFYAERGGGER